MDFQEQQKQQKKSMLDRALCRAEHVYNLWGTEYERRK